MRLFYAVNFSETFRRALEEIATELELSAVFGRRTLPENFHLTLVFLGEQERFEPFAELLDAVKARPFTLKSSAAGYFQRSGGGVYWLGLRQHEELSSVHGQLVAALRERHIAIGGENFRPHVTLLRQALMPEEFDLRGFNASLNVMSERVDGVSLMLSTREKGKLVYRELHRKSLA